MLLHAHQLSLFLWQLPWLTRPGLVGIAPPSSGIPGIFPQGRGTWWKHLCGYLVEAAFAFKDGCTVFGATYHSGQRDFLGETPIEVSKSSVEALGEAGTWNRSSQMPLLPSVYSFVVELCDFSPHISPAYICFGETGTNRSQTSQKAPEQREACL